MEVQQAEGKVLLEMRKRGGISFKAHPAVNGSGSILVTGVGVSGTGTAFTTELSAGDYMVISTYVTGANVSGVLSEMIATVHNDTYMELRAPL